MGFLWVVKGVKGVNGVNGVIGGGDGDREVDIVVSDAEVGGGFCM